MSPIRLFLCQLVAIAFVYILEQSAKKTQWKKLHENLKLIGGIILISIFGTAFWAIFYY